MSKQLGEPIFDRGILNTNFFNGRLLTADDLRADQKANRQQHQQLGTAIGEGVITGLEVNLISAGSATSLPVVTVTSGLALNRRGYILALPDDEQVTLTRKVDLPPFEAGLFVDCGSATSTFTSLANGVYLLAIAPASGFKERAPLRALSQQDAIAGCGSRYIAEGVEFRLIKIEIDTISGISPQTRNTIKELLDLNDAASLSKLRNIIAHFCYITEEEVAAVVDPFSSHGERLVSTKAGGLGTLDRAGVLSDCEVGLALLLWKNQVVHFADMWAVRRLTRHAKPIGVLSQVPASGFERLMQFQDHLRSLAENLGGLTSVEVQQYFRFIPPAGFYPVAGAGSPKGFHKNRFLSKFSTGTQTRLGAGKFAEIVHRSYVYPAIDLESTPVVEIYQVSDNLKAVESGDSNQLYQIFVARALEGPHMQDGVSQAFYDAWEVYRGLIKRRAFLLPGTNQDIIASHFTITAAIRDVLDIANRQYTLAANFGLDSADALKAFQDIYRVQNELATLFQTGIPVHDETNDRETFAQGLSVLLKTAIPGGRPGLQPAVQANNLLAAVDAQNAINLYVGGWTGEGVAIGPFGSAWQSSPEGQRLVPGRAFPQQFIVSNGTDKSLRIELEATATAPHGDWTSSTRIENLSGAEISFVDLASSASTTVVVQVTAPVEATIGDTATLTLQTHVAPPTNRTSETTLPLEVATSGGPGVDSSVAFDGPVQAPANTDNAAPGAILSYIYNLRYTAPLGITAPTRFQFAVTLTSDTLAQWAVGFGDVDEPEIISTGVFGEEIQLAPSVSRQVEVMIRTPNARATTDKTATFTVHVQSLDLSQQISATHPQTQSIRLRHN